MSKLESEKNPLEEPTKVAQMNDFLSKMASPESEERRRVIKETKESRRDFLEVQQRLRETLIEKTADPELAEDIISRIDSILDRHKRPLKDNTEVYEIIDKVLKRDIRQDELFENLIVRLEITPEEEEEMKEVEEMSLRLIVVLDELERIGTIKKEIDDTLRELNKRLPA